MLVVSFSQQVFAQCNIDKSVKDSIALISAKSENLYKNDDLENGVKSVYGYVYVYCHQGANKYHKKIAIISGASGDQAFVFPRSLIIVFSNSATITLKAVSDDMLDIKGVTAVKCYYSLSDNEWYLLKNFDITSMMIYDNRIGITLVMHPYPGILKEQAECITNEIGDSN